MNEKRQSGTNYLNASYGLKSWLLTTDHKRIALLYLVSVSAMFLLGGVFAALVRILLLTPKGDLFPADEYNKMFTMHGVVMIFFFLIPAVPAVLGNFLVPMMIGAKDLAGQLDRLVARYPRQYGGQRGLFLRADLRFRGKDWEGARADWEQLARRFPASYLASVSLFNAGVCAEEKGDLEAAQALYMRVADGYKDSGAAPRALFDAGRLDEQKGAWDEARRKYELLESDYASSSWTKLAKNRIISLKVEGKLK